jgi:hypothetical protein
MEKVSAPKKKKKIQGFPLFLHFKKFKTALKVDRRQRSSRQRHHRYHRRSESIVKKK